MHLKKLFNFDFFLNLNLMFKPENIIPDFKIRGLSELDPILKSFDIQGLVFDIDQTIVPFRETSVSPEYSDRLQRWAKRYRCCLLSNFIPSKKGIVRIREIEKQIHIEAVFAADKKPSLQAFRQALKFIDQPAERTVMIGDRILTDIVGANAAGMKTVLLKPLNPKTDPLFLVTLPRWLETAYLKLIELLFAR